MEHLEGEQVTEPVPAKKVRKIPPWQPYLEGLLDSKFTRVAILAELSPQQLIAAFILQSIGVIDPDAHIIVRDDHRLSQGLKSSALVLFDERVSNPAMLARAIDQKCERNSPQRSNLWRLALHLQMYRKYPHHQWWRIQDDLKAASPLDQQIFNYLRYNMILSAYSPWGVHRHAYTALERLLENRTASFDNLAPVALEVPFLKNKPDEPDKIDVVALHFDRCRALMLTDDLAKFTIAVGGSPNSGKSTVAASLTVLLGQLVEGCQADNIIPKIRIQTGLCNLDLASPTAEQILRGEEVKRDHHRGEWTAQLVAEAVALAEAAKRDPSFDILVYDLPGRVSDITNKLARSADFAIWVDRSLDMKGPWNEFLLGPYQPNYIAAVHTRYHEAGRQSGLRNYFSRVHGDRYNHTKGRLVDLDRSLKLDDQILCFLAHELLFNILPGRVMAAMEYQAKLLPRTKLMAKNTLETLDGNVKLPIKGEAVGTQ